MPAVVAFWLWFGAAVLALGILWSDAQLGLGRLGIVDALAAALLLFSLLVLGRAMYRLARQSRR